MRTIPSSQFRVSYASLTEPVIVTVNGHSIGYWRPLPPDDEDTDMTYSAPGPIPSTRTDMFRGRLDDVNTAAETVPTRSVKPSAPPENVIGAMSQAQRDAVLRKLSR